MISHSGLTDNQYASVCIVCRGYSNKETATMLNRSIKTVEKHVQAAYDLLRVHDRVSLAHYALAKGWVQNKYIDKI